MGLVYSALQKSFRAGDVKATSYWSEQLGVPYPNALRKRITQNSLEDACGLRLALTCLKSTNKSKPSFEELKPYVFALTNVKKTHSAAWLNRVAADHLFKGHPGNPKGSEVDQAAYTLKLHSNANESELRSLYGEELMRLYLYINRDPLVFMCSILISGRPELAANQSFALGSLPPPVPQQVLDHYHDKHTKLGKKMGRGYSHFLQNLILHNPVYTDSVEPYKEQAEYLYLNFKDSNGKECRVRHVLDLMKEKKTLVLQDSDSDVTHPKDTDVLHVNETTVGLGFKNATFICPVNMSMISNSVTCSGEMVVKKFCKLGENPEDLQYALHCAQFRSSLRGLYSLPTTVTTLEISGQIDYGSIAALGKGGEKWRRGVEAKIAKIVKKQGGKAETMLVDVFDNGVRLSDVTVGDSMYSHADFGFELVKVLIFRKMCGCSDTNAFNLMCRVAPGTVLQILSADENKASKEALLRSMGAGLETAQKIKYDYKLKCAEALVERTEEVDGFVKGMKRLWTERFKDLIGEGGRMDETHARFFREWNEGKDAAGVCMKWLGVKAWDIGKKRKVEVCRGESKKRTKT